MSGNLSHGDMRNMEDKTFKRQWQRKEMHKYSNSSIPLGNHAIEIKKKFRSL